MANRTRRGRGEGSIFQRRRDNRWCAIVTVNGRSKWRVAKTKQEALAKLHALQSQEGRARYPDRERVTVSAFLDRWAGKADVREKTRRFYKDAIETDITPAIGSVTVGRLRPVHVKDLLDGMRCSGRSPHLCRRAYATLHAALATAVQTEMVDRNACDAVKRPRVVEKKITPLTADQANALLSAASKEDEHRAQIALAARHPQKRWTTPSYPLLAVAIGTGLRFGEILGLRWRDVELESGKVEVIHRLDETSRSLEATKTEAGRRTVALPASVVAALQDLRKQVLSRGPGTQYVFCNRAGGPLRQANFTRRLFKPLLEEAKLPNIRFHDLRHTASTLALERGISPKVLQARLGHKSISTTMNIYGHVLPSMDRDAAEKIDRVFEAR